MPEFVYDELGIADGYENITPGDTATGITAALQENAAGQAARAALITVEDNDVHFTYDGTTVTNAAGTNKGHRLLSGESVVIRGKSNVKNFQCVDRVSGSAGIVKVTVFR